LAGVLVALAFAVRAHERARLWVGDERLLIADAARHYPDGGNAHFLAALRAIERGDEEAAVSALRAAVDRGYDHSRAFDADPLLDPIRDAPGFELLMREVAARHIEYGRERGSSSQVWLRSMALAHQSRGEYAEAASLLERAIRTEGPLEESLLISEFWAAHQKYLRQRREEGETEATRNPTVR
jgi:tetratricopeptide (TPR) repeat protein